jgi:hypothetical protein
MAMPAIDAAEPDEETREYVETDEPTAAEAASDSPGPDSPRPDTRRVRIVLLALVLLAIAAALIVWGLLR